jgi:CIC family chloride channel protein
VFLARFVLGAVSYSAGVSGGLFAPMLTLGAQLGAIFGTVCRLNASAAAVVGMAAFFAAVVRAPLTGIVLIRDRKGA